jgi:hypothetical protein
MRHALLGKAKKPLSSEKACSWPASAGNYPSAVRQSDFWPTQVLGAATANVTLPGAVTGMSDGRAGLCRPLLTGDRGRCTADPKPGQLTRNLLAVVLKPCRQEVGHSATSATRFSR